MEAIELGKALAELQRKCERWPGFELDVVAWAREAEALRYAVVQAAQDLPDYQVQFKIEAAMMEVHQNLEPIIAGRDAGARTRILTIARGFNGACREVQRLRQLIELPPDVAPTMQAAGAGGDIAALEGAEFYSAMAERLLRWAGMLQESGLTGILRKEIGETVRPKPYKNPPPLQTRYSELVRGGGDGRERALLETALGLLGIMQGEGKPGIKPLPVDTVERLRALSKGFRSLATPAGEGGDDAGPAAPAPAGGAAGRGGGGGKAGKGPPRKRRQRIPRETLTPKQLEAFEAFAECKGNYVQTAKRLGKSPAATRERIEGAYRKLGQQVPTFKAKTQSLPTDRRGQPLLRKRHEENDSYTHEGLVKSKQEPTDD